MGVPSYGDLAVRITVVVHASPRWKGAKTAHEADVLNQRLSELRARNVQQVVEPIIKNQLPGLKIEVPAKGVGSHERFPTAGEDNAAMDRSVVVMVDLITTTPSYKPVPRPPHRIHVTSKIWTLRVLTLTRASVGYSNVYLAILVTNPFTKRAIKMAGYLHGGDLDLDIGKKGITTKPSLDRNLPGAPIGDEVTFMTLKAMDFHDWMPSRMVRLNHGTLGLIRKWETTILQFTDLDTNHALAVEFSKGWGWPAIDLSVVAGRLDVIGQNPGDFLEFPSLPDEIPVKVTSRDSDGLLLSFPTGKASVDDLTKDDRKRLIDFVTIK